jgi:hypothetical protein
MQFWKHNGEVKVLKENLPIISIFERTRFDEKRARHIPQIPFNATDLMEESGSNTGVISFHLPDTG